MTRSTYTNNALEAACEAIEEWELTPDEEAALVENLLGELQARRENRNEDAYAEAYDPERIAGCEEAYRRNMIAAGRGGATRMRYGDKDYDQSEHYRKWGHAMPALNFKPDWDVRIIPPFGGAAARFIVEWGGLKVSVYADFDSSLGAVDEPYWEIYPAADGDTDRFLIHDAEKLIEAIDLSLISPRRRPE